MMGRPMPVCLILTPESSFEMEIFNPKNPKLHLILASLFPVVHSSSFEFCI